MAQNYYWSKTTNSFYPVILLDSYKTAGSFPSDAVLIDDSIFRTYAGSPPEGKTRGSDISGNPTWVDVVKDNILPTCLQAEIALSKARTYIQNTFIYLGEAPPKEWIEYQKELMAIIKNGSDSVKLPESPAEK